MADEEEPEPEEYAPVGPRYPCDVCGRSFAQETLEKHTPICAKHAAKRRRVFDSSKQRLQELEEALPKKTTKKVKASSSDKRPSSKWKEDHRELVSTVREARVASAKRSSVTTNLTGGNEKCPHCDRSFGPKAIERHVSFCKELKARIPQSPLNSQAKERQDARLKYKVPTGKTQRSLTREKYSPGLGQIKDSNIMSSRLSVASTCSTLSTAHGMRTPSTGRSPVRQSTNGNPLKENQNSSQSSHHRKKSPSPRVWQRSPSPSKNRGRSTNSYAQDSQESSSLRARVEPEGGEDDLSSSCNLTRAHRGVGDDNRGRKHKQAEDRERCPSLVSVRDISPSEERRKYQEEKPERDSCQRTTNGNLNQQPNDSRPGSRFSLNVAENRKTWSDCNRTVPPKEDAKSQPKEKDPNSRKWKPTKVPVLVANAKQPAKATVGKQQQGSQQNKFEVKLNDIDVNEANQDMVVFVYPTEEQSDHEDEDHNDSHESKRLMLNKTYSFEHSNASEEMLPEGANDKPEDDYKRYFSPPDSAENIRNSTPLPKDDAYTQETFETNSEDEGTSAVSDDSIEVERNQLNVEEGGEDDKCVRDSKVQSPKDDDDACRGAASTESLKDDTVDKQFDMICKELRTQLEQNLSQIDKSRNGDFSNPSASKMYAVEKSDDHITTGTSEQTSEVVHATDELNGKPPSSRSGVSKTHSPPRKEQRTVVTNNKSTNPSIKRSKANKSSSDPALHGKQKNRIDSEATTHRNQNIEIIEDPAEDVNQYAVKNCGKSDTTLNLKKESIPERPAPLLKSRKKKQASDQGVELQHIQTCIQTEPYEEVNRRAMLAEALNEVLMEKIYGPVNMHKSKNGQLRNKQRPNPTKNVVLPPILEPQGRKQWKNISTTSNDSYDPYAFAERQMMELLGLGDFHPSPKQPTVLETSPTSAFSKYKSSKDKRPESPTKQLMISGVSTFTNPCQVLHGDVNRNIDNKDDDDDSLTLSLNNLTICNPISVKPQRKKPINCEINLDNQLNETDPFLSVNRIPLGKKNSYPAFSHSSPTKPTVQRSFSLVDAKPAVVRREERRKPEDWKQMMNHASNSDEEASSPDSAANRRLSGGKPSGDSAYSSLNRKSPYAELNKETQLEEDLEAHLSSSDSEASLPSICLQNDSTRGREKSPFTMPSSPVKLPKFCHECGTKYPIQFAKFCCECGVRRLVL